MWVQRIRGRSGSHLGSEPTPHFANRNWPEVSRWLGKGCQGGTAQPGLDLGQGTTGKEKVRQLGNLPQQLVLPPWDQGIFQVLWPQPGRASSRLDGRAVCYSFRCLTNVYQV